MEGINGRAYYLKNYNKSFNSQQKYKNNSACGLRNLTTHKHHTNKLLLTKV